ncbi:MAG: GNAT family N-acetyltransferase [Dehalococcoidia bacterium]
MTPVRMAAAQLPETAAVLGRAFFDDPPIVWAVPDDETRERVLAPFMALSLQYGHRYGEVYISDGAIEGAAIWLPSPASSAGGMRVMMRFVLSALLVGDTKLWTSPIHIGWTGLRRFMTVNNRFEEIHKRDMHGPHWHLITLGVEPERQGQGVGGALIQPVLERADGEHLPCYLETAKERNLTFYRRHGFEVVVDEHLPNSGPRFWTMKREPR